MSFAPRLPLPLAGEDTPGTPRHQPCTRDHERLAVEGAGATAGTPAFAARALGDAVGLRPPEAGTWTEAGKSGGQIASPTGVGDLCAPASDRGPKADTAPADDPGVVNAAPCTGGRLLRSRVGNPAGALTPDVHTAHCAHTRGDRR